MTLSNPNTLTPKRPSRSHIKIVENSLRTTNDLPTAAFTAEFFPPDWSTWTSPRTGDTFALTAYRSLELSEDELEACFRLIEETSGHDYNDSSIGWSEAAKKKEMLSPDLRYILIRPSSQDTITNTSISSIPIQGFVSWMPTFENQQPVLYLYEIHLSPRLRGTGLGKYLLRDITIPTAAKIPHLEKVMLTCFKSNEVAMGFYQRLGFEVDESSPEDRRLRGGRVVTSDYVILSCRIGQVISGAPLGDGEGG